MGLLSFLQEVFDDPAKQKGTMSCHSIDNPAVPFSFPINGIPKGAEFVVQGSSFTGSNNGFSIDFLASANDIALHINPRFKFLEHTIVFNTYQYGKWQREERHGNKIKHGDQFRLRIVNRDTDYMIELNDHHLAQFKHRIDARYISAVEIKGDITIHGVRFYNFQDHINVNPAAPVPQPQFHVPEPQPNPSAQFSSPQITSPGAPTSNSYYNYPTPGAANDPGYYPATHSSSSASASAPAPQMPAPYAAPYPSAPLSTYSSTPGGNVSYPSLNLVEGAGFGSPSGCSECGGHGKPYGCTVCRRFN